MIDSERFAAELSLGPAPSFRGRAFLVLSAMFAGVLLGILL